MIEWNPDPEILRIGAVALRWYSLAFMLSFYLGFLILKWIFDKEKKPMPDLDKLFMSVFFATIIGARLGHCLFYDPSYYLSNPLEILKIWKGGLASHGAAIAILTALYLYSRNRPTRSHVWILDRVALPVALSGFFIRMGNLFNSEIIGKPADVPWAFIFTKVDDIPRHPSQIYEALAYLALFMILVYIYRKSFEKTPKGLLMGIFFIGIFGSRFVIEFFKENQSPFEQGMFINMGQLLSIPLVLSGLYFVIRAYWKQAEQKE